MSMQGIKRFVPCIAKFSKQGLCFRTPFAQRHKIHISIGTDQSLISMSTWTLEIDSEATEHTQQNAFGPSGLNDTRGFFFYVSNGLCYITHGCTWGWSLSSSFRNERR